MPLEKVPARRISAAWEPSSKKRLRYIPIGKEVFEKV